ncbi:hypothetical protein M9434_003496 [Picochlorum sp. BPE23]|nr:hypothetical protein M9434_003496 [Picochlorum sp. BPE23]
MASAFFQNTFGSSNATTTTATDQMFGSNEGQGLPTASVDDMSRMIPTNTLDEPIAETIRRDLIRIYKNLVMVVFPIEDRSQQSAALRNWDLWGPMIFTLGLAIPLSIGAAKPSSTFSLVFGLLSIGALVLTVNVVLLGGTIGFFQSLCLLGYCLFPLNVAAILFLFVRNPIVRWIVMPLAVMWASWASVPFVGGAVPENRRALAIYPLGLLYTVIGWLAIIK